MRLGDVYWVAFPPRGGHAQAGRRPAIVLQDEPASSRLPTVLAIPMTTQLDALRFPGTVLVEPDAANGLSRPSVALVFQLAAIDRRFFESFAGRVSGTILREIREALDDLTGRSQS